MKNKPAVVLIIVAVAGGKGSCRFPSSTTLRYVVVGFVV